METAERFMSGTSGKISLALIFRIFQVGKVILNKFKIIYHAVLSFFRDKLGKKEFIFGGKTDICLNSSIIDLDNFVQF